MRRFRRKGDGQWRDSVQRRIRLTEPKFRRPANDPKSGLMILGEQVSDATME